MRINYEVLLGDEPTARLYGGIESLPATFLIDLTGKITTSHTGLVSKNTYEREILKLIGH